MIKLFFTTLLLFSATSNSCEVSGPANIIYSGKSSNTQALHNLNFTACTNKEIEDIRDSLSDFEGTIRRRTLMAEIPGSKISIRKPISIKRLETLINDKVDLPKDWRLINPEILGTNNKFINYKDGSLISVECQSCENTGLKNLKLEIFDHINAKKTAVWLKASVAVKTKVLAATHALPVNHRGLSLSSIRNNTIYSTTPEVFFTNRSQLIFYKLNKGKKKNQAIKFTDLSPLNLVRPGQIVRTSLKAGVINLKGNATPMKAGKLGEVIQLRSTNSKKIIIGRVINFNEVEVEL